MKGINHIDTEIRVQIEPTLPSTNVESEPPLHALDCPHAELVTFWKKTTYADLHYKSPFKDFGPANKYVTFEPGNLEQLFLYFLSTNEHLALI